MNVRIPLDNSMDMLDELMESESRSLKGLKVMWPIPSSCRRHRTLHKRIPCHQLIVFIVFSFFSLFFLHCFMPTVSSTRSKVNDRFT